MSFCKLSCEDAHQSFNCQQWGCVVAQVGAGIHDGVDLFDGWLWFGFFSQRALNPHKEVTWTSI